MPGSAAAVFASRQLDSPETAGRAVLAREQAGPLDAQQGAGAILSAASGVSSPPHYLVREDLIGIVGEAAVAAAAKVRACFGVDHVAVLGAALRTWSACVALVRAAEAERERRDGQRVEGLRVQLAATVARH
eukprot:3217432-Pleurochrysis_carterae.AAC.2